MALSLLGSGGAVNLEGGPVSMVRSVESSLRTPVKRAAQPADPVAELRARRKAAAKALEDLAAELVRYADIPVGNKRLAANGLLMRAGWLRLEHAWRMAIVDVRRMLVVYERVDDRLRDVFREARQIVDSIEGAPRSDS